MPPRVTYDTSGPVFVVDLVDGEVARTVKFDESHLVARVESGRSKKLAEGRGIRTGHSHEGEGLVEKLSCADGDEVRVLPAFVAYCECRFPVAVDYEDRFLETGVVSGQKRDIRTVFRISVDDDVVDVSFAHHRLQGLAAPFVFFRDDPHFPSRHLDLGVGEILKFYLYGHCRSQHTPPARACQADTIKFKND